MPNPNHLGALRKHWKLSDEELADLLGYRFKSAVCRAEKDDRPPTIKFALGCEVVFGRCPRDLFPEFYAEIEEDVIGRAIRLDEKLREDKSPDADIKRQLLLEMVQRSGIRSEA